MMYKLHINYIFLTMIHYFFYMIRFQIWVLGMKIFVSFECCYEPFSVGWWLLELFAASRRVGLKELNAFESNSIGITHLVKLSGCWFHWWFRFSLLWLFCAACSSRCFWSFLFAPSYAASRLNRRDREGERFYSFECFSSR